MPGGGSSARAYFPDLVEALQGRAKVLELDPPGHDVTTGRRWLKLADHARFLAKATAQDGDGPVVIVGHSLGALVALRFVLDHGELVGGLLLLDPSPPIFGLLLPIPLLRLVGIVWRPFRRTSRRPVPSPRALPFATRLRWYMGATFPLAIDLAATRPIEVPAVVVSADEHRPESVFRRTHTRLADRLDARLEVWPGTTHGVPTERPQEVWERVLVLLEHAAR